MATTKKDTKLEEQPRPQGRPPLPPGTAQTAMIRERVTEAQRAVYERLGGKAWLVQALAISSGGQEPARKSRK